MKARIKTDEVLIKEGFTPDYPRWYKGTKKDKEATFLSFWAKTLLGQEVDIVDVSDHERGEVNISFRGQLYRAVPHWLFDRSFNIAKIPKPISKRFSWASKSVKYTKGFHVEFPCVFERLNIEQARELAKWILAIK